MVAVLEKAQLERLTPGLAPVDRNVLGVSVGCAYPADGAGDTQVEPGLVMCLLVADALVAGGWQVPDMLNAVSLVSAALLAVGRDTVVALMQGTRPEPAFLQIINGRFVAISRGGRPQELYDLSARKAVPRVGEMPVWSLSFALGGIYLQSLARTGGPSAQAASALIERLTPGSSPPRTDSPPSSPQTSTG